jgi:hypothetical protein
MTTPARFRQADVARLVRGAVEGGWPVGSFQVVVDGSRLSLLPAPPAPPPVAASEDSEGAWTARMAAWRKSG